MQISAGELAAQACDAQRLTGHNGGRLDHAADLLQGLQHDAGVVRIQQVVDGGRALTQRC